MVVRVVINSTPAERPRTDHSIQLAGFVAAVARAGEGVPAPHGVLGGLRLSNGTQEASPTDLAGAVPRCGCRTGAGTDRETTAAGAVFPRLGRDWWREQAGCGYCGLRELVVW